MRTMCKVEFTAEHGNHAVKDGSIGAILEKTAADIKPEACYFFSENGNRTAYWFFDLKESSDMPRIAERFFHHLNAKVTFHPVMNLEELKKGINKIER